MSSSEEPVRVVLLGRSGCHLCDDARAVVAKVCAETGAAWREDDIDGPDTPRDLRLRHTDEVPVTFVDGVLHDFWRVDEARLRALHSVAEAGTATLSSDALATAAGVNSAKVRKDLSYLGSYGTRGVGYDVAYLVHQISRELGLTQRWAVAIVGIGNLGHALARYGGFATRGFRVAALLDADPSRVGEWVDGVAVSHVDDMVEVVREREVSIGVIATPAGVAQDVCDRLVAAGVTSILNFAPTVLTVPPGVDLRKVDLSIELQILSFHEQRKAGRTNAEAVGS